jgi:hydroxymethylpyrimidine/phosphomethylpyrimidine kinase
VVLDPVMVAKSGDALLRDDAVEALLEELVPLCSLVTPNLPELERMTGQPAGQAAAEELSRRGPAVLAKGGHAAPEGNTDEVVDLLIADGQVYRFRHRRLATSSTHGTGCTLSSAIAARLGRGAQLPRAVGGAIEYLQGAMAAAYPVGSGHGPVDHLYELFPGREA